PSNISSPLPATTARSRQSSFAPSSAPLAPLRVFDAWPPVQLFQLSGFRAFRLSPASRPYCIPAPFALRFTLENSLWAWIWMCVANRRLSYAANENRTSVGRHPRLAGHNQARGGRP